MTRYKRARFLANRALCLVALLTGSAILALSQQPVPACPPVQDIHNFVQVWNDAVIGPGSRNHTCTLGLLTPDARITGVDPGKDGKPQPVIQTPQHIVGW